MSNRFGFGKNWKTYIIRINDEHIDEAEKSLLEWLGHDDLSGKTFLDIGSGSGIFSLAAKRLGATVHSFDYDRDSVLCGLYLKKKYFKDDTSWTIEEGDILDEVYLQKYDEHDIVYSWGVLHHTGNMYKALGNAGAKVKKNGKLFISIYNDQGGASKVWRKVKKLYNVLPGYAKLVVVFPCVIRLWGPTTIKDFLRLKPFSTWKNYKKQRGMSPWTDVIDWVGGYPFEVAKPEDVFKFYHERGFNLEKMSTCGGGHGCNQYLFRRV